MSLTQAKFWSMIIIENYYRKTVGPHEFLTPLDQFPSRFPKDINLFFWSILNCCLTDGEHRFTSNLILDCYESCEKIKLRSHSNSCRESFKARLWKCYGGNGDSSQH